MENLSSPRESACGRAKAEAGWDGGSRPRPLWPSGSVLRFSPLGNSLLASCTPRARHAAHLDGVRSPAPPRPRLWVAAQCVCSASVAQASYVVFGSSVWRIALRRQEGSRHCTCFLVSLQTDATRSARGLPSLIICSSMCHFSFSPPSSYRSFFLCLPTLPSPLGYLKVPASRVRLEGKWREANLYRGNPLRERPNFFEGRPDPPEASSGKVLEPNLYRGEPRLTRGERTNFFRGDPPTPRTSLSIL